MRYLITHNGPSLFDCDCHERSRVTGEDGVARLSVTDTVEARSLTEARRGVDRRCVVELGDPSPSGTDVSEATPLERAWARARAESGL